MLLGELGSRLRGNDVVENRKVILNPSLIAREQLAPSIAVDRAGHATILPALRD